MHRAKVKARLTALYPPFASLPPGKLDALLAEASTVTVPAGTMMFDAENPCMAFPLLLEGTVRVSKTAPNGRELQLYRVVPGEACVLTSSCLLGKGKVIHTTHQQLADELGSVHEIVSRLLRSFADQGLVSLGREQIEIRDPAGLRAIAPPA